MQGAIWAVERTVKLRGSPLPAAAPSAEPARSRRGSRCRRSGRKARRFAAARISPSRTKAGNGRGDPAPSLKRSELLCYVRRGAACRKQLEIPLERALRLLAAPELQVCVPEIRIGHGAIPSRSPSTRARESSCRPKTAGTPFRTATRRSMTKRCRTTSKLTWSQLGNAPQILMQSPRPDCAAGRQLVFRGPTPK